MKQYDNVVGCTIVSWWKSGGPSHNPHVILSKIITEGGDCCMWHQLSRGVGQVGRVTIESWHLDCYTLKWKEL